MHINSTYAAVIDRATVKSTAFWKLFVGLSRPARVLLDSVCWLVSRRRPYSCRIHAWIYGHIGGKPHQRRLLEQVEQLHGSILTTGASCRKSMLALAP
eukprot:scaffold165777_cov33-Tisochrysis_lutea.AAC.3